MAEAIAMLMSVGCMAAIPPTKRLILPPSSWNIVPRSTKVNDVPPRSRSWATASKLAARFFSGTSGKESAAASGFSLALSLGEQADSPKRAVSRDRETTAILMSRA